MISLPEAVCDVHVHTGFFPQLQVTFTLDKLNSVIKKYGIDSVLVFSSWFSPFVDTNKILRAAEVNRRIYVLIRANPMDYIEPDFRRRLEFLLKSSSQVVGMKINPSTEKHRVVDNLYRDCLEVLNDFEAVLLLHCGRWVKMSSWTYGLEVALKYPKIKVILAHMGGTHPELSFPAIEAVKDVKNIYMDTSQTRQLMVIKRGVETLGSSRILFGSDMPWGNYLQNIVGVLDLDLDESDMNNILRENFNKIIKGE